MRGGDIARAHRVGASDEAVEFGRSVVLPQPAQELARGGASNYLRRAGIARTFDDALVDFEDVRRAELAGLDASRDGGDDLSRLASMGRGAAFLFGE